MYEWVSVHEASRRLNRSVSTIRRQIESGELVGEREPLAKGSNRDRYRVRLDAPATPDDAPPSEPPDAPEAAPAAITALVDALAAERAERQRLSTENGELRERAARAEALAEAREDALEWTEARRAELQAELEQLRRPWWRRLW